MDIITKTKQNIEELNQRFFLILENFVTTYISYLQQPTNQSVVDEIQYINTVVNKIESDGFILKNNIDSGIQESQHKMRQQSGLINKIKLENEELNKRASQLKITTVTSEGLFDEEIAWYRLQLKLLVIMIIGVILCGKLYYDLQLTKTENLVIIGGALFIGFIEYVSMYVYTTIKNYRNKKK